MKKFLRFKSVFATIAIILVAITFVAPMVFATGSAVSIVNTERTMYNSAQFTLISGATGTTAAYTTNYALLDYPMNNISCDVISGAYSAATLTFTISSNQGSSTSLFDATPNLITSTSFSTSASASVMKTVTKADTPFRLVTAIVTAPSATEIITINCSATK